MTDYDYIDDRNVFSVRRVMKTVDDRKQWGVIDDAGAEILPVQYDYIATPVHASLFVFFVGNFEWDEYDEAGEKLFEDVIDDRNSWNGDYFEAALPQGRWGLVNAANELLIEPKYNALYFYSASILIANENGSRIIKWYHGDDKRSNWSAARGTWRAFTIDGRPIAEMSNNAQQHEFHTKLLALGPWDPAYGTQTVTAYFER